MPAQPKANFTYLRFSTEAVFEPLMSDSANELLRMPNMQRHDRKTAITQAKTMFVPGTQVTVWEQREDMQWELIAAGENVADFEEFGYVYVLYDAMSNRVKIGHTMRLNSVRQRSQLCAGPVQLINVANFKVADPKAAELMLHKHFKDSCTTREWFDQPLHEVLEKCAELDYIMFDAESIGSILLHKVQYGPEKKMWR